MTKRRNVKPHRFRAHCALWWKNHAFGHLPFLAVGPEEVDGHGHPPLAGQQRLPDGRVAVVAGAAEEAADAEDHLEGPRLIIITI